MRKEEAVVEGKEEDVEVRGKEEDKDEGKV